MLMLPDNCDHSWPHETEPCSKKRCVTSEAQICIKKIKVTAALKSSALEKMFDVSVQNLFKHIYRSNVDLICESLHDLPSRQNLPEQATAIPDKYI